MEMAEKKLKYFGEQLKEIEQFIDNTIPALIDMRQCLEVSKACIDEMRRELREALVNQQEGPS